MTISVEQLIWIFVITGVYWLIGRFIARITCTKNEDEAMKYTVILLWPVLTFCALVFAFVKIILALTGGGRKTE